MYIQLISNNTYAINVKKNVIGFVHVMTNVQSITSLALVLF